MSFPHLGEQSKTRRVKEEVEDEMVQGGCGRDCVLLALGGGVVCDLGGFVASTYMRGIPYIMIATSLLSMVDASVGGKTAVDTAQTKNLVGSFYPPAVCSLLFWIISPLLPTLPL